MSTVSKNRNTWCPAKHLLVLKSSDKREEAYTEQLESLTSNLMLLSVSIDKGKANILFSKLRYN